MEELYGDKTFNSLPEDKRTVLHIMYIGVPITKELFGLILIFASGGLAKLLTKKKQ